METGICLFRAETSPCTGHWEWDTIQDGMGLRFEQDNHYQDYGIFALGFSKLGLGMH